MSSYQNNGREKTYPDNVRLISTTNLNGQITYATNEISKTIDAIQVHVNTTAATMERSRDKAETGIAQAVRASEAFDQVVQSMTQISEHSMQIATAAEQQSAVSDEISKNIVSIRDIAQSNMSAADKTTQASQELQLLVKDLRASVLAFST